MEQSDQAESGLGTVEKALDVLWHLHGAGERGVSDVGRALGLPRSTAHRLLAALGRRGLVERSAGGRYRPGMALVALGLGVLEREPVVAAARRVLEERADALGETIFLAAARAGRLIVLDKEEGSGFLRASPRVGSEIPAHATAIGKLYLAFAPDLVPSGPRERFTPRTSTRAEALARESAHTRARGFAENREEWIPGLYGVAAPVWLGERLVAALAVAAPFSRADAAARRRFAAAVSEAANEVAARLAGRGA